MASRTKGKKLQLTLTGSIAIAWTIPRLCNRSISLILDTSKRTAIPYTHRRLSSDNYSSISLTSWMLAPSINQVMLSMKEIPLAPETLPFTTLYISPM